MSKGDQDAKPKQILNTPTEDGAKDGFVFLNKNGEYKHVSVDSKKFDALWDDMNMRYDKFVPNRTRTLVERAETVSGSKEEDILSMIKLGAKWGSNLRTITTRGNAEEKDLIRKLTVNYKLEPKPLWSDSVTLSRVMQAYPVKTCEYVASMTDHKVTDAMMDLSYYPPQMKCAAFGNFIPRMYAKRWEPLVKAFAYHQFLFHDIINPRDSRSASDKMREVLRYIGLTKFSNLYEDPIRIAYLCQWGIYDRASDTFSSHVLAAAAKVDTLAQDMNTLDACWC